jgi:preprotein translocase subunit SecD
VKKVVLAVLIVCLFGVVSLLLLSGLAVYSQHQRMALLVKRPDHGAAFVIEADLARVAGGANVMPNLKETMRRRFERLGVGIYCESLSPSRIRVVAPITDAKSVALARQLASLDGHLEFHLVPENSGQFAAGGQIPAGCEWVKPAEILPAGRQPAAVLLLKTQPEPGLSGNIVQHAALRHDHTGGLRIDFELSRDGAIALAEITRKNPGRRLAIVLGGQWYCAPVIQSPIITGQGQITGGFEERDARQLATLLEYPLPVTVTLVELKTF